MCGIIGEFRFHERVAPSLFEHMLEPLAHRGPDSAGIVYLDLERVALGHRRLAIIDLSATGSQPMASEDESAWIVFNGEIYNYRDLREELAALGHFFRGTSDTEVLLHGYLEWGDGVVERLSGMFAFAIWDARVRSMLLVRDRFGVKPLYLCQTSHRIVFASELKSILRDPTVPRQLNLAAVRDFFLLRYIASPNTPWKGIEKIPPATCVRIDRSGERKQWCYWRPEPDRRILPFEKASEEARELLSRSVRNHLVADVPVGLLLSGGMDSTSLLAMTINNGAKPTCFTIGFEGWEKSEHIHASNAAKAFKGRHRVRIINELTESLFEKAAWHYDDLLGGTSFWPTMELADFACREVKVVLAGDGGDELMAGYTWHQRCRSQAAALSAYASAMSWLGMTAGDIEKLVPSEESHPDAIEIFRPHYAPELGLQKALQMIDIATFLPEVVLAKIDRATMRFGLEARVPFLDHRFAEFMLSLDESVYSLPRINKPFLRRLLEPDLPPIFFDHPKQGFSAPLKPFFRHEDMRSAVLKGDAVRDGVLDAVQAARWLDIPQAAFALRLFTAWYQTWVSQTHSAHFAS